MSTVIHKTESPDAPMVAIIGGGPAGLMAADRLSAAGRQVTIYDRMPSLGRKFLMAGRGGLNLTHSEDFDQFSARYGDAAEWMTPILTQFDPARLMAWVRELGQEVFIGSSGRVFPVAMKASPLLRALLARLGERGVVFRSRLDWQGWDSEGGLVFRNAQGEVETIIPAATILALGGASWPRLGADGGWVDFLTQRQVAVSTLRPSNCGFTIAWSDVFRDRFAGQPLKNVAFALGERRIRGEAMITAYGVEGGAIYALSAPLRDTIERDGAASLDLDLRPDLSVSALTANLAKPRQRHSLATHLRKHGGLTPVAVNLLREANGLELPNDAASLARLIKSVRLRLDSPRPLDRAISTAGGVARAELDGTLMLRKIPGVFAAGEMLDWEAPTGGYLLQACFATGIAAAEGALSWLDRGLPTPPTRS